jgi:hypothetical protein
MKNTASSNDARDQAFYRKNIAPLLPPAVLDFHAHTWSSANWTAKPWETGLPGGKYMVTNEEYLPEDLLRDGSLCFPDRPYYAVCFGYPTPVVDWIKDTEFIIQASRRHNRLFPLVLGGRELNLTREHYEAAMNREPFFGFKVFLNWFGDNYGNKSIDEMLGPVEMRLAHERRLIVLLHVPRSGRLADPDIQKGVRRLALEYPGSQIVLAHAGRCYLPGEMKAAIGGIADLPNVALDTSMVMDPVTIQLAMREIGPRRLLFATDFPVAAMRGRRVRVMDHWVDVVAPGYPKSAYRVEGDVPAVFMTWEIILAIHWASDLCGLGLEDRHGIYYDNGIRLLQQVDGGKTMAAWKAKR